MRPSITKSLFLTLVIGFVAVRPAFAYIDPNVGGQLFQILVTGFAVISGLVLLFSRQIRAGVAKAKRFIRERIGSEEDDEA